MGLKKLQIRRLSQSGEVISVVNCPAGKITVLRESNAGDLDPYKRAFAGVPGAEKFTIEIDGQTMEMAKHRLIGFGNETRIPANTVREFLSASANAAAVDSLLISFGLEDIADKNPSSISDCARRRLLILSACQDPSKVLVLNNPFEPIGSTWRERIAEMLASSGKASGRITLITALDFRPSCWIDNDTIQRIQLGQDTQKTIGFAGSESEVQGIIEEVRRESKKVVKKPVEETTRTPSVGITKPLDKSKTIAKFRRRVRIFTGIAAALIFILLFVGREESPDKHQVVMTQPSATPITQPTSLNTPTAPTISATAPSAFVLDLYGPEIKRSIIRAFDGLGSTTSKAPSVALRQAAWEKQGPRTNEFAGGLLKALEGASGTGYGSPSQPSGVPLVQTGPAVELSTEEREERREAIRQKFLEAISKANQG